MKVSKNKDFLWNGNATPKENILKVNQYIKSNKMSYISYADLEFLIKKIDRYANNP